MTTDGSLVVPFLSVYISWKFWRVKGDQSDQSQEFHRNLSVGCNTPYPRLLNEMNLLIESLTSPHK